MIALVRELLGVGNVLELTAPAAAEVLAARAHGRYWTPSSSTSNTSVAFGGITPPAPRAP